MAESNSTQQITKPYKPSGRYPIGIARPPAGCLKWIGGSFGNKSMKITEDVLDEFGVGHEFDASEILENIHKFEWQQRSKGRPDSVSENLLACFKSFYEANNMHPEDRVVYEQYLKSIAA